jgi:hypothetical protein
MHPYIRCPYTIPSADLSDEKQKLENYVNKTLQAVQAKYMEGMALHKDQIKEKDAKIGQLKRKLKMDKASQKREEDLVMSAFYEVGMELQRRMMVSGGTENSEMLMLAYQKDHIKEEEVLAYHKIGGSTCGGGGDLPEV